MKKTEECIRCGGGGKIKGLIFRRVCPTCLGSGSVPKPTIRITPIPMAAKALEEDRASTSEVLCHSQGLGRDLFAEELLSKILQNESDSKNRLHFRVDG
jgi:DnaJ-class molecular chaperone